MDVGHSTVSSQYFSPIKEHDAPKHDLIVAPYASQAQARGVIRPDHVLWLGPLLGTLVVYFSG